MTGVNVTDRDGVRTITLDRPESRNGLTIEVCLAIREALACDARVIVVTGANGAFCSGLDLKDAMRRGFGTSHTPGDDARAAFHGVIHGIVGAPCPTIAVVDGPAVGFGCDMALACDLRIASDRATFGEIFVKRGLMPDGGGTHFLPRIIGLGRALELMYTGELVDAARAHAIGLANRVVPQAELAARVAELTDQIAAGPPLAFRRTKQAVYAGLSDDLDAALDREAAGQMALLQSRDFAEGITAFLQKRTPKFQGS